MAAREAPRRRPTTSAAASAPRPWSIANIRSCSKRRSDCGVRSSGVADRTEHFVGDAQGRDNLTTAEMALDANGRFLAMRVDILGNLGAYLSQFGPYIPWLGATMATGPYDIPTLHARVRGVYTHTVPVDAYRGAGRPEAAYVLERLVDACARDARHCARRNPRAQFRQADADALPHADRPHLRRRRFRRRDARLPRTRPIMPGFDAPRRGGARSAASIRGLGIASYIECTAWGDGEDGLGRAREGRRLHRADRHAVERSGP